MGRQQAFGSLVGQAMVNRQSAVSLGYRQKKSQPDEGWDFTLWWWGATTGQTVSE